MKLETLLWLGMFGIILALAAWSIHQGIKLDSAESVIREKDAKIDYWRTEAGKTVSSKPAAEITKADLQEHYHDVAADLKDMQIKLNQVKAVLRAVVEAKGEGIVRIIRDTVRVATGLESRDSLFVDDGFLDFRSSISFTEDAGYKYTYQDSILFALVRKKKGLFGKKELYGQVRMSNPSSRAIGQTSILISERQKRFYVGVGASYNPFTNQLEPGVQAGYKLISF